MARIPDYVKVIEYDSGTKRYEIRVEVGKVNGKRKQRQLRFAKLQDAIDAYNTERGDRARGVQISPADLTVRQACDAYLDGLHVAPNTLDNYATTLRPAVARFGDKPVQDIGRTDIEKLLKAMLAGPVASCDWRKPVNPRGQNMRKGTSTFSAASVRQTRARLVSVWERLVEDGTVPRNVAALTKVPEKTSTEHATLTVGQLQQLFASLEGDRLEHLHHLAVQTGLRRGELAGLRWEDVRLDEKPPRILVRQQRVHERAGVRLAETKTDAGTREIPIPSTLLSILKRAKKRADAEKLAMGNKWRGEGDGWVIAHEDGSAWYPTTLDKLWKDALADAGLPHVRLHDARHTCGTLMHLNGVPITVIAAVLGHANAAFTMQTYAHSQVAAVAAGMETLAAALEPPKPEKDKDKQTD
ncbi:MAG: site-specific integrase [Mycobacterium sp.]|nr:site-specific integrase [Mycobacterium sp.]